VQPHASINNFEMQPYYNQIQSQNKTQASGLQRQPSPPPLPPPPNETGCGLVTFLGIRTEEHPSKTMIMIGLCNENYYHYKQQIFRKAQKKRQSQDFIVSSNIKGKPCFLRLFLNTTWISKRCSIIFVKKCLARCVPMYLPIQNIYHAYTVSVCTA